MQEVEAKRELREVLAEWRRGGGTLAGLLWAWFEVVTGRVKVDEIKYSWVDTTSNSKPRTRWPRNTSTTTQKRIVGQRTKSR